MFKILEDNDILELDGVVDYITETINTIGGTREDIEDCIEQLEKLEKNEVLTAIDGVDGVISLHTFIGTNGVFYKKFMEKERVYFQIQKN